VLFAKDLRKVYGQNVAVDGVSLEIQPGEIFGLLGPNGAGKSTTIGMLAGYIEPDSGEAGISEVGSPQNPKVRRLIGLAPQALALYEELTAEENLGFCAKLYGVRGSKLRQRIEWSLDLAGLADRSQEPVSKFSGGMKRRLNLACALVHDPAIVFLDEPTAGVDPQSRAYIFEAVERLRNEGLTVVYTTHYMEEAQRLCDRVAIMDRGKILALDTVDNLIEEHGGGSLVTVELERVPENLAYAEGELVETTLRIQTDRPFMEVAKIASMSLPMTSLKVDRPDLEAVFLHLTGRSLRD
jgi:ABC-2 type transport system ATP-binding protein